MLDSQQLQQLIVQHQDSLVQKIVARHYLQHPELLKRYGESGLEKCRKDANYHLTYLGEALSVAHPSLFASYIAWVKVLLAGLGVPEKDLADNLRVIQEVLTQEFPDFPRLADYVGAGLKQLSDLPCQLPSFIEDQHPHANLAQRYLSNLLKGKRHAASQLILDALQQGIHVKDIYLHVFQRSQYEIGRLWQMNQISVAQEHYCTAATQLIMSQLYPYIFTTEKTGHVLVAACVGEELHEIGMRMVSDFFEMAGWDTFYLGANMPTASILDELKQRKASVLAISATMTFHIRATTHLIEAVRANPELDAVKIIVGGYCFNIEPTLWQQVGADGYAPNAEQAVEIANKLIKHHFPLL